MGFGAFYIKFGVKYIDFGVKHMKFGANYMDYGANYISFGVYDYGCLTISNLVSRKTSTNSGLAARPITLSKNTDYESTI